ncbi:MAG: hypothetical protein ABJA62_05285, partial [Luteimonas sp.]
MIGEIAAAGLTVVALLLLVPVTVIALQVASALGRRSPGNEPVAGADATPRPSVAVLMPAHDEASGVANAIASVQAQLATADRVLVVADNCSDTTA